MNFKMIAEIMLALDAGQRIAVLRNIGTQFYAEYQKINGELYRINGTEKILQGGFDINNITGFKIIEEQPATEIERLEKRTDKFETPLVETVF